MRGCRWLGGGFIGWGRLGVGRDMYLVLVLDSHSKVQEHDNTKKHIQMTSFVFAASDVFRYFKKITFE